MLAKAAQMHTHAARFDAPLRIVHIHVWGRWGEKQHMRFAIYICCGLETQNTYAAAAKSPRVTLVLRLLKSQCGRGVFLRSVDCAHTKLMLWQTQVARFGWENNKPLSKLWWRFKAGKTHSCWNFFKYFNWMTLLKKTRTWYVYLSCVESIAISFGIFLICDQFSNFKGRVIRWLKELSLQYLYFNYSKYIVLLITKVSLEHTKKVIFFSGLSKLTIMFLFVCWKIK